MSVPVASLTMITSVCPTQWEGRTPDGRFIYIRYRGHRLTVGIGDTIDDAVFDESLAVKVNVHDHDSGRLTLEELQQYTGGVLEFTPDSDLEHA